MTKRCGYYIKDGKLCRRDVEIAWDLGFDRAAKHEYIHRIITELGEDLEPAVDVTTASYIKEAKMLSPFYTKCGQNSFEYTWDILKETMGDMANIPGVFEFMYLNSLRDDQVVFALSQKCFIDVFHNPGKAVHTQAKALAILQLLVEHHKLYLLKDMQEFVIWFAGYCEEYLI